jgi:signal peptidase I
VLRDVYYIAANGSDNDYLGYSSSYATPRIREILEDPSRWNGNELFLTRQTKEFPALGEDDFLPLGDNSPSSSDARYWQNPYVERKLLTGKALFIYWPHSWNAPVPFTPNFSRMRFIR